MSSPVKMESAAPTAPLTASHGQYTILRIKRKRNEEPLDALVVESIIRRKKSKGGVGVFQYAQTVENSAWDDEKSQKDIQDAISKLSRESAAQSEPGAEVRQSSPLAPRQASPSRKRRFTIVEVDKITSPTKQKLDPISQTDTSRDVDQPPLPPDFRMYDAIPSAPVVEEPVEEDPEMVKFQAMLSDYLRINDVPLSPPPTESPMQVPAASKNDSRMKPPTADDGDYVWDIFYHRPTSLSEWNDLANVGMLSSFPTALFDEDYDSESESEIADEADEDSNEEDYYKNDYPDEEETDSDAEDSDEWHEHSDYDDTMGYHNEDEEFNS
ncbi:hypothetical protein EST38_g2989 [Candolleomyces aberdarensis]|uniref:Probable RNA polymerase II nuclear localization protein SLC7A6OS n=1 Tax=Candolleomyces aberdarensis TaxID=2316362 RepID=A0A4Q2DU67_9AGAR|nr:hypothetical protein EST38_g2989 [Candolleomyces aberdarensis]